MAHGDARVGGEWRGNWRMEWVASTLHTTSEHGVSSITTADGHTSAANSPKNWRPSRFKWTRPFRRKTKSGFCACAITFQTQSTYSYSVLLLVVCELQLICYGKRIAVSLYCIFRVFTVHVSRSYWPRGITRSFAVARLLRLWVQIPRRPCKSVSCECCVLSGKGL